MEAGGTILNYRLSAKLGEGGMGVVWRATDTTLDREVAIKFLPPLFTSDPERLARFEREAKVLASLNHPNVAGIYGLHESGPDRFLSMELVQGEDLAQRLARGKFPPDEALRVGLGIAAALEYAHEQGIVHRDLKPANVKVTPDGSVKVLDFGLAKALEPGSSRSGDLSLSPTITIAGTQAGVILGTAAYMSPEQAAGRAADRRADIWSFGAVLFEMLVGRQVFSGETVSHLLAAVLKDEPDWAALPSDLPPRVRELLERCLRKDRQRRFQSIGDARVMLEEILADPRGSGGSSVSAASARSSAQGRLPRALPWLLAATLGTALVAVLAWQTFARPDAAPAGLATFAIPLPAGYRPAMQDYPCVAISADGRRLAIVGRDASGTRRIILRDLGEIEPRVLEGTEGAEMPFFSPNGEWLGFFTGETLKKQAVAGGRPVTLARVTYNNRGATWADDDTIYLADSTQGGLLKVPASGGAAEPFTERDASRNERTHRWPHAVAGGATLLFTADTFATTEYYDDATIEALAIATKERTVVVDQSSQAQYLPEGLLVFARGGALFAQPFDPDARRTRGSPALVLQGVATDAASGAVHFALSRAGSILYLQGDLSGGGRRELVWLSAEGQSEPSGISAGRHEQMRLSPDGGRAALLSSGGESGELSIWIADLSRGVLSRLTFQGTPADPVWSPDGTRVAYSNTVGGREDQGTDIYWQAADGSGAAELLLSGTDGTAPMDFSPDGRFLAVDRWDTSNASDIWILPLDDDRTPRAFTETPFDESMAEFSPDGRWIAYVSDESGTQEVYVRPFPGPGGRWQVSSRIGLEPRWSPDGRALYYRSEGILQRVAVDGSGSAFVSGRPGPVREGLVLGGSPNTFAISQDGRRFLALQPTEVTSGPSSATLILNWSAEVRRLSVSRK